MEQSGLFVKKNRPAQQTTEQIGLFVWKKYLIIGEKWEKPC